MRDAAKFLVLTFVATWAIWVLLLVAAPTTQAPLLALGGPVFLVGVFAPGLVAVALTWIEGGAAAAGALLGRIGRWRVDAKLYAVALLLMPVAKLLTAAWLRIATGAWPAFGETHPLLLLGATLFSTVGQAGEEVGWRGYLLPRLAARTGLAAASLAVGVVWALWHLPLFSAPGADTYHRSFPLFALQVVAYSVALAWLYWRSGGSLLLTMLMHAAFNNLKDIVPSAMPLGASPLTLESTPVFRLTLLVLWIVAAVLLVSMRRAPRGAQAQAGMFSTLP